MLLEGENGFKLCQDARHPGRSGPAFPPSQLRDRGWAGHWGVLACQAQQASATPTRRPQRGLWQGLESASGGFSCLSTCPAQLNASWDPVARGGGAPCAEARPAVVGGTPFAVRQGAPGPRHRGLDLPIRVRSQPACSGERLLLRVSSVPTARLPKQVPRVRNRTVCFAGRRILKVTTPKVDGAARATTMPVTTRASMSTEVGPGAAAGGGWCGGHSRALRAPGGRVRGISLCFCLKTKAIENSPPLGAVLLFPVKKWRLHSGTNVPLSCRPFSSSC